MSSIYDNYPAVRYVDEYDKATDEQCVRCKGNCGFIGITGMWACKGFVPMTNADRIRCMSDEELAEFFEDWFSCGIMRHGCFANEKDCSLDCKRAWLDWLKKEVEDG